MGQTGGYALIRVRRREKESSKNVYRYVRDVVVWFMMLMFWALQRSTRIRSGNHVHVVVLNSLGDCVPAS